ncbi:MAG TPA: NAD(+)/NADH kinase [Polyangiaceae bacterium]|nr:NAD(+)/NADH kinase [Polyangiaceae bacterium]
MTAPRVVVVVKRTLYARFVEDENDPVVRRLLRRNDPSVARWRTAHREHLGTLHEVERALDRLSARVWVVHGPRVVFDASDAALVVTVGGDGTLLAASHHVGAVPILGVNSSPNSSVGFFCGSRKENVAAKLEKALDGELPSVRLSRMRVAVNGRIVSRRVLNEALFSHTIPAAASRYLLRHGRRMEEQVSSGFWISTAAGSTGALHSAGGKVMPLGSKRLEVVVREPLARHRYKMTNFFVEPGSELTAINKMRDARLFLDGPFRTVNVHLGDQVSFAASEEPVRVLGLTSRRGRR